MKTPFRFASAVAFSFPFMVYAEHGQQWTQPTPEELSMTSIPQVPGASAVYLYKEETTDDSLHMFSHYVRLKVLTDKGKEYANVELPYVTGESGRSIDEIAGRTIHPDGSVVPFTGKPYDKLIVKSQTFKYKAKVFTLPAVEVGSIIEYRYKERMGDNWFSSPEWMIQSELYTRKAHYMWRPTAELLTSEDGKEVSNTIAWAPLLPPGAKVEEKQLYKGSLARSGDPNSELTLDMHDVPPILNEEFMPPMGSVSYRVLFYYTHFKTVQDYWASEGKTWSKSRDKFIGPNKGVREYVSTLISPSDTQDQKVHKIYAAVMLLENTDFSRERTASEEKAQGLKQLNTTDDILARKRGNGDQLDMLFIAMCRAAGLKAYAMGVADRSVRIFLPNFLSARQLDDDIAIVNVDGKEVYFDPGERYCEPKHLAWKHTLNGGLRQTDGGTTLVSAPAANYMDERVGRVADLKLDDHGVATGQVIVTYQGDAALHWRQEALKGDDTSLNQDLRESMESKLPGGMEIRVTSVEGLADFDKPLVVKYDIKGAVGSSTGKRVLISANLFESNEKPKFPEAKREVAVDMRYPSVEQDAVRFQYPESMTIESSPAAEKTMLQQVASYEVHSKPGTHSITFYRNYVNSKSLYVPDMYGDLRTFYGKMENKDQETLVLTRATATDATTTTAKPAGN